MSFGKRDDVTVADYIEMVQKKTGALYAASAAIGGMLAGGAPMHVDALYSYGLAAGVAFQIQDDLIDIAEQKSKIGKDRGSDLREGKQTLIAMIAREKGFDLSGYRRNLSNTEMDELIAKLEKLGVVDEVRRIAVEYAETAKHALQVLPSSDERDLLVELVDYFISRGS
jgi:geranylgeranyl diphosphate synthase type I